MIDKEFVRVAKHSIQYAYLTRLLHCARVAWVTPDYQTVLVQPLITLNCGDISTFQLIANLCFVQIKGKKICSLNCS